MTETLDVSPAACVARGVAWLDAVVPGWASRVDLEVFDFANGESCIFGQVFDSWTDGLDQLGADDFRTVDPAIVAAATEHGGMPYDGPQDVVARYLGVLRFKDYRDGDSYVSWSPLEEEWRRVITERQEQPA